jgi:hypothetical protein
LLSRRYLNEAQPPESGNVVGLFCPVCRVDFTDVSHDSDSIAARGLGDVDARGRLSHHAIGNAFSRDLMNIASESVSGLRDPSEATLCEVCASSFMR